MTREEITKKVAEILSKSVDVSNLKEEDSFKVLGLDSLDLVEMVMEIEDSFGVQFETEEIISFEVFKDVLDCLESKLK